ncbi:MAG TPA: tetratricopeptide repeat protein [Terriglobia bacterium]|nr:tetratricopeptide repeat protein [Terriglobia bacterium]
MMKKRPLLIVFIAVFAGAATARAAAPAQVSEAEQIKVARQGLDLLMNGEPDAAIKVFEKIESGDPDSALGYLMEADALWWKIFLATGNLIDPDVFEVGPSSSSPYDSRFNSLIDQSIAKARANRRANRDVARNYLYEGMAYGLRGRLAAMRDSNLAAARAAKQMRSLLLKALQHDRNLRDAYAGLGLYDYFVDTLPTIVKLLRWMIGLPGGDRERGLQEIEYAAKYGELTHAEALFYLAKDYSRSSEHQYARSLELFQKLRSQYPRNGLWTLMAGSLEIRMGHIKEGEALYREALEQARGKQTAAAEALHKAALKALQRRHPDQHYE